MRSSAVTQDDIQPVPSPYAGTRLSTRQHLAISGYWFASNVLWGAFLAIILQHHAMVISGHNREVLSASSASNWLQQLSLTIATDKAKALGFLTGAVAIVSLFVPLIVGALSDRCASRWGRRRPYMAAGSLITMCALGLMFLAASSLQLWLLAGAYCLVALGNNVATAAYSGVIPDVVPDDQRGIASGWMAMMSQIGTLTGAAVAGWLVGSGHIGAAYAFVATVIAICTAYTFLGIKENPLPSKPPPIKWGAYIKSLWIDPRQYPDFAWVWGTRFLVMLGFYSIQPYINYYLHDVIGIQTPEKVAPLLLGLILIGATASGLYGGALSERIGRKKVVYVANVVIAAMSIALVFCRTLPQALTVGMIFGLAYGAYISVDWALGTDVLPSDRDAGKDMAVWHISMTLPQSITPIIAGVFMGAFSSTWYSGPGGERLQSYPVQGYLLTFAMAAVFFLLGAFFLRNVKKAR